jgi:dTMP kinase
MLVAIEGLDGSGKSSLMENLASLLRRTDEAFVLTYEPTDGPIGREIKAYLEEDGERNLALEALMFAADRVWHLENLIGPALQEGKIVVTDRYKYSSLAYQSSPEIPEEWIEEINAFAPEAEVAVFLDADPETCRHRLEGTRRMASVMDDLETQWAIYRRYLDMVEAGRLIMVNGKRSQREVAEEVFELILEGSG